MPRTNALNFTCLFKRKTDCRYTLRSSATPRRNKKMKKIVLSLILVSTAAFANDIHLRNGETANIVVDNCKSSEYGSIVKAPLWKNISYVTATCVPKVCRCEYYVKIFGG